MRALAAVLAVLISGGPVFGGEPVQVTLDEALSLARSRSPAIRELVVQLRDPGAWALDLPVEYAPQVSVSLVQRDRYGLAGPDHRETRWGASVSQLVFDAGRGGRSREWARWERNLLSEDLDQAVWELDSTVRGLFLGILAQDLKLEALGRVRTLADHYLALAQTKGTLGLARDLDLVEAEIQRAQVNADWNRESRGRAGSLASLAQLLGLDPRSPLDLKGALDLGYPGLELPSEPGWTARAVSLDPHLKRQELALRRGELARWESLSAWIPDIRLEWGISFSGTSLPLHQPQWQAQVSFRFPDPGIPVSQTTSLDVVPGESWAPAAAWTLGMPPLIPRLSVDPGIEEARTNQARGAAWLGFEALAAEYRLLVGEAGLRRTVLSLAEKKKNLLEQQAGWGESTWVESLEAEVRWARDRADLAGTVVRLKELEAGLEGRLGLVPGGLGPWVGRGGL